MHVLSMSMRVAALSPSSSSSTSSTVTFPLPLPASAAAVAAACRGGIVDIMPNATFIGSYRAVQSRRWCGVVPRCR